jgi:DNA ligase (NAD+)
LAQADEEALAQVESVGPIVASMVVAYFQNKANQLLLTRLCAYGVIASEDVAQVEQTGRLSGQYYVITGKFARSRTVLKTELEALGAVVLDTVTKKTTAVIVGQKAGSKLEKAKQLGVQQLDEVAVARLLAQSDLSE